MGHVARMVTVRISHRILVGKPEINRPIGRPGHGYEDSVKIHMKRNRVCDCVDRFYRVDGNRSVCRNAG